MSDVECMKLPYTTSEKSQKPFKSLKGSSFTAGV
jgi:hypothetical protein